MNTNGIQKINHNTLYVANLDQNMNNDLMRFYFEKISRCKSCKVIYEFKNDPIPYAIIELEDDCDADLVIKKMHGKSYMNKKVVVFTSLDICKMFVVQAKFDYLTKCPNQFKNQILGSKKNRQDIYNNFEKNLNDLDECINLSEMIIKKPVDHIYNKFSEMKRLIQLDLEETIARYKESNDIDINTDENKLEPKLLAKVNELIDKSQLMIDRVEAFQKKILFFYSYNKLPNQEALIEEFNELKEFYKKNKDELSVEIRAMIAQSQTLVDQVEKFSLKIKDLFYNSSEILIKEIMEKDLTELKELVKKYQYVDDERTKLENLETNVERSKLSMNKLKSSFYFKGIMELDQKNTNRKNYDELSCSLKESLYIDNDVDPVLEEILKKTFYLEAFNDKYLILHGTESTKCLSLFNPILCKVEKELNYIPHIHTVKRMHTNSQDLIAIQYKYPLQFKTNTFETNQDYYLNLNSIVLINKNFEIIKKIDLLDNLIGFDEENLYFIDFNSVLVFDDDISTSTPFKVKVYDCNLNEVSTITFQSSDKAASFYLPKYNRQINQIERRNEKYFVKHVKCLSIYDLDGVLIKSTEEISFKDEFFFRFNKTNNLIVVGDCSLFYFDLNGSLITRIDLNHEQTHVEPLRFSMDWIASNYHFILDEQDNPKFYRKNKYIY